MSLSEAGLERSVEPLPGVSKALGAIPGAAETLLEASLRPQSLAREWQLLGAPFQSSVGAGELLELGTPSPLVC